MNRLNSFPSAQPSTPTVYFQSAAAASYTKKASPIKEGKAITRLSFEDNQDTRLYLAAKVVHHKQTLASIKRCLAKVFQCVELPVDHQTSVLLNINSASKRLHLAKSAIKKAARNGNLLQLLHDATASMSILLAHYQDMKPLCELLSKKLDASAEARKKEVSPALLLKVIDTAFKHYSKNEEGKSFQFTYQGRTFFAHPKEGHLELVYLYKQLGVGGYGKVYQMIGLNDGRDSALKQARSDKGIEANEEIKNEYAQLTCIHSQGPVWGIQTKPGKLFQTVSLLNQNQWGYETERYDHSY